MSDRIRIKNTDFIVVQNPFSEADYEYERERADTDNLPMFVSAFNTFPMIDLQAEIDGESELLTAIALQSMKVPSTVFCGITTSIMGLKHISVAVCHKGKLADIVDRTQNPYGDSFLTGDKIKIFSNGEIAVGLFVDTDVLLETNWEKAVPECDVILTLLRGTDDDTMDAALSIAKNYDIDFLAVNESGIRWKEKNSSASMKS